MMTIDVAAAANDAVKAISGVAYECLNNQSTMSRTGGGPLNGGTPRSGGSPPVVDMAQHMLRNILQGVGRNKKDLYALERELREASNINNNDDSSHNKNSKETDKNSKETELDVDCIDDATLLNNNNGDHVNNNEEMSVDEDDNEEVDEEEEDDMDDVIPLKLNADDNEETSGDDDFKNYPAKCLINGAIDSTGIAADKDQFVVSPRHQSSHERVSVKKSISLAESIMINNNNFDKDDCDDLIKEGTPSQRSEQKELKRARVENIVSGMRSSPLPVPVNGCKKRKLYHPQQHDNSVADCYTDRDIAEALSEDEDETSCPVEMRKKVIEKNVLKNQLRSVQEQLAEMHQKYTQLCTRIEQDPMEFKKEPSDSDQDEDKIRVASPSKEENVPSPPPTGTKKDGYSVSGIIGRTSQAPVLPKMLASKLLPHSILPTNALRLNQHAFPLHPNFNPTALSFLQHQIFQEQQHAAAAVAATQNHYQSHRRPYHLNTAQGHPTFNNADALYLGINQKLALEQEVLLAKEAALAANTHQLQQQSQRPQGPAAQFTRPPRSNSPRVYSAQREDNQNMGSTKEPGSPKHIRNDPSQTTAGNPFSSISSISSISLPPQQHSLQSTKTNADTTVTASSKLKTEPGHTTSGNVLDLEGLAESLKTEIATTLSTLIDTIMNRFLQQKRSPNKTSEAEQLNKDLFLASQLLDHKVSRTKVDDRINDAAASEKNQPSNEPSQLSPSKSNSRPNSINSSPNSCDNNAVNASATTSHLENNMNSLNIATVARTGFGSSLLPSPKLGSAGCLNSVAAAAAFYSSVTNGLANSHLNPLCGADLRLDAAAPEQNEALSLVVPQKKKRHKVTDTRITPRTVSRILAQDGSSCQPPSSLLDASKYGLSGGTGVPDSPPPPPRPFHHLTHSASMLPVSLPTSVAIPNPSLHESQVFSPYSPFYGGQHPPTHHLPSSSPPGIGDHIRHSPPLPHHTSMFHPALLAAAQQHQHHQKQQQQHREQQHREQQSHHHRGSSSPDFMNLLPNSGHGGDSMGPDSECNSMDLDGLPPTSSTLSPMHLRKAKLMFFWVRYPTSAVLKMYFPDIRFNKNNTAQLVKWFSNFREFYYIQMEKYARAAIGDGIKNADDIHVSIDSDIYRVLNLHYNRNNHIEVPSNFRYVVEQTLKEFFKAIQMGKDQDQSWKKPIYKVIGRLDDPVPDYFKSPNFLEQLE